MERFVSLMVNQGDSFYLQRDNYLIIVDGGLAKNSLTSFFKINGGNVIESNMVDILVCTHNDADHATGILGFLKDERLSCKEIWLPGTWASRLGDILVSPSVFLDELAENIHKKSIIDLATYGDALSDYEQMLDVKNMMEDYFQLEELHNDFEVSSEKDFDIFHLAYMTKHNIWWQLDPDKIEIFVEAINAAKMIKDIALAAFQKGVTIKWFEYDKYEMASGGIKDILEPLNSKEISKIRKLGALEYLALSKSNKQSLVFHSPKTLNAPAVLFSADSDFGFDQTIPWSNDMIITASHHGSKSNQNCYKRYNNDNPEALNSIWVRSDGRFKSRPGDWYLEIASTQRYCTRCSPNFTSSQNVEFNNNQFKWHSSANTCMCRQ
ncbi:MULTISPECIES: hypothetical protein [Paenibacillus]|uniref:Metallo-beta-lactamase domain-containing protein n=1 Tax=Paenibacillus odorifer TaxID=189426 RepID=A0ABX3HYQ7_9BACL|nr:hypothetical protein [Paenibacillus odorifer]OMD55311.1 hypothetical protein BSK51_04460 [Paenibacillus odorifer]